MAQPQTILISGGKAIRADHVCDAEEVGRRLGVAGGTVHTWRYRELGFPELAGRVGGKPWWWWPHVETWARQTGRLT